MKTRTPNANVNNPLILVRKFLENRAVKQLGFLVGIAGAVALGVTLVMSMQDPQFRPLDYQVNTKNMSAITDALDKAGITYKINDQDGILYVAEKDVQAARLRLTAAGIAKDNGFDFSYLNDQSSFGSNQFNENARFTLALEQDLAKTISAIEGVSGAKVHIAMPRYNVFADENRTPTASVVLNMSPGYVGDKEKIRAIVEIVASSVPGLDPKDVAVTDQYGHNLSDALNLDSLFNTEQLNYQNNVQHYYEKRIESLIQPIVGSDQVNVRVYADIDFSQGEEAQEEYDPKQQAVRSEETRTEENGAANASGAAGALSNTPPAGASGSGGSSNSTSSSSESIKNYELGKTIKYKKTNAAQIKSLSVAVVVGNMVKVDPENNQQTSTPPTKETLQQITELVKASIGFDEKRGDNVTVVNSAFNPVETVAKVPPAKIWEQYWFWDWSKKLIISLLGFAFLFVLFKRLTKHYREAVDTGESSTASVTGLIGTSPVYELKQEQLDKLKEIANRDPNRVSAIIRAWVNKNE